MYCTYIYNKYLAQINNHFQDASQPHTYLASSPSESSSSPGTVPDSPPPPAAAALLLLLFSIASFAVAAKSALKGSVGASCPHVFFCAKAMKSSKVTSPAVR